MTHSLTRLGSSGGSNHHGAQPMAQFCRECGKPVTNIPGKVEKEFDTPAHRMKFVNRRRERGSHLYDLIMQDRYAKDRPQADTAEQIEALLRKWHKEDLEEREGRPSWNTPPKPK